MRIKNEDRSYQIIESLSFISVLDINKRLHKD